LVLSCFRPDNNIDTSNGKSVVLLKHYYPTKIVKEKGALIDSIKQGYWISFDSTGKLQCECVYINDTLNGPFILYYPNGNIEIEGYVYAGNWKGERISYYSNRNIRNKGSYKNNELDGIWDYFDENGNLDKKILYKNGIRVKIIEDNKLTPIFP